MIVFTTRTVLSIKQLQILLAGYLTTSAAQCQWEMSSAWQINSKMMTQIAKAACRVLRSLS